MRRPTLWTMTGMSVLAFAGSLGAQNVVLDEGSFRLTVNGRPAGTETFVISRAPGPDASIFARGEIDMTDDGGRIDLRPVLESGGPEMAVAAYQIKISGQEQQEIYVQPANGRYQIEIRSQRGEQSRETRAAPGTLILDTGVAHQYYFLSTRIPSGGGSVPVVVPREGRQFELRVTEVGQESVAIAGRDVSARHLRLEGNGEVRDLWVDTQGRVLRVDHPATGYSAVRERAP